MRTERPQSDEYYFHAGVYDPLDQDVRWSPHTRKSANKAEKQALVMARKIGAEVEAIVEYWDKDRGLFPRDCECVLGSWRVQ